MVEVLPTATGATSQVRALTFTITGIDFLTEADLKNHPVVIDVYDATRLNNINANAWVWGAAEAPSGVVFSPDKPAAAVLVADERATRK